MSRKQPAAASGSDSSLLPQHSLVAIHWLDAAFDLDRELEPLEMVTIGYLIRRNERYALVAGESSAKLDYFRAYTVIPVGMIQRIQPLQPASAA